MYDYLGVDRQGDKWAFALKDHIEKHIQKIDICVFDWSRGISKIFSINPAVKKLSNFLKTLHNYDRVVLFGKSLGGIVMENSLQNYKGLVSNIHLIYVATPHKRDSTNLPQGIKITNIFSNEDIFFNLGLKLLHFGFGHKKLNDANNIVIKNMKHADFNQNIIIPYQGKKQKLFDLYIKLISE